MLQSVAYKKAALLGRFSRAFLGTGLGTILGTIHTGLHVIAQRYTAIILYIV